MWCFFINFLVNYVSAWHSGAADVPNNIESKPTPLVYGEFTLSLIFTFTFMHLADAFIQSDLQLHSGYTFLSVYVFPGNRTHNLCTADAMLYHWATQEHIMYVVMICSIIRSNLFFQKFIFIF